MQLSEFFILRHKIDSPFVELVLNYMNCRYKYDATTPSRFKAAKVLTLEGTQAHDTGISRELEFMQDVRTAKKTWELQILRDHFRVKGPGPEGEGEHLCFITDLLAMDVRSIMQCAPERALPIHVVSNILERVTQAVMDLHALNIIHTGNSKCCAID